MGKSMGGTTIGTFGRSVQISADGDPIRKSSGITVDWASVAAASENLTLNDNVSVLTGEKYLRYGQVLTRITAGEINTLTVGGSSISGNFTLSLGGATSSAIAYNASNATIRGAVEALATVGTGNVAVSGTTGASGGTLTFTFNQSLGNVSLSGNATNLTNGTLTFATTSQGGRYGKYGPYDPDAVDGRATVENGAVVIVGETVKEEDTRSNHPDPIIGGELWKSRIIANSSAGSLADGPTYTVLVSALPSIRWKLDE
jgi:hypothetical protein